MRSGTGIKPYFYLFLFILSILFSCAAPVPVDVTLPERWRGFNLVGKFDVNWSNRGFIEEDFRMISELGFNFVRLPLDYRTYTARGDWYSYKEKALANIDQAVEWGRKHGIHVCINLHRAPGYCVNQPAHPLPRDQDISLWENKKAQQAFVAHWKMFAARYRGVPNKWVSFNLVNEPEGIPGQTYAFVMGLAVKGIRHIDPGRLIVIDGLEWANSPCFECVPLNVPQAAHFYQPFRLTHYKAEWAQGSDTWPEPVWPAALIPQYLYGPDKRDIQAPFTLHGEFSAGTKVTVKVQQVSVHSRLILSADDMTLIDKTFSPGPGEGEWTKVVYSEQWGIYQNIYNTTYRAVLTQPASILSLKNTEGDWLIFSEISITKDDGEETVLFPSINSWGVPQGEYALNQDGSLAVLSVPPGFEKYYEGPNSISEWQELENAGTPVFVGEWGVYRYTPHNVTLAFMEDQLKKMKKAGYGWALWNFRGPFGILDSEREDVMYEEYKGHKLDRAMLELLQGY